MQGAFRPGISLNILISLFLRREIICSNISVANIFTEARALKQLAKRLLPYILCLSQPRVNARLRKPQTSKLSYLIDFSLHVSFRNWN